MANGYLKTPNSQHVLTHTSKKRKRLTKKLYYNVWRFSWDTCISRLYPITR